MKFKFKNLPKKISKEVYSNCLERYLRILKKNENVVSIYQIGSIKFPGISDIDLIAVYKDSTSKDFKTYYDELNDEARYIFMHPVFVITESLFENIRYIFPIFNLKHLYGKKHKIKKYDKKINLFYIIDYLNTVGPQNYYWIYKKKKFNQTRFLLCAMSSLSHFYNMYVELTKDKILEFERLIKDVENLKGKCFELEKNKKKFIDCFYDSFKCLLLLEKRFSHFLSKIIHANFNNLIYKGREFDYKILLYKDGGTTKIPLVSKPKTFALPLIELSKYDNKIKKNISMKGEGSYDIDKKYGDFAKKRYKYLSEAIKFSNKFDYSSNYLNYYSPNVNLMKRAYFLYNEIKAEIMKENGKL